MSKRYYPSLDGLRGVAVAIVLMAHAGTSALRSGGVGVDIFFTLSGFLITSILLAECDLRGSINIKNFYARRFLRLIPCLWMTVAAHIIYCWVVGDGYMSEVIKDSAYALLYVMNWVRAYNPDWNGGLGHTWSLAIEEQYYLLWPLIVLGLTWFAWHRPLLGWLIASASLALAAYRATLVGIVPPQRLYFGLDTHSDSLLVGSALACFVAGLRGQSLPIFWSRMTGYLFAPCAVVGLASVAHFWTWRDPEMGLFGYPLSAVLSAVLILDLVSSSHSLIRRPLTFGPLVWVGKVSYGVYLWHTLVYDAIRRFDFIWGYRTFVVGGTLSLLVATLSYSFVEKPFLNLKDRFKESKP